MKKVFTIILVASIILSQNIFAQNSSSLPASGNDSLLLVYKTWDQFSIRFGGFLSSYNSDITFGSKSVGLGLIIDLEDALGLETSSIILRGRANYRFGKTRRHAVGFGYFAINRRSTKVLDSALTIGQIIYPIGTEIKSRYDLTIFRVRYDYSFYQDDRISIGVSGGLFIMPVKFTIQANGQQDHNTWFTVPLPLLGLRTDFKISNKFYLKQSVEILYLSFDFFTGSVLDLNIALEHNTFKHFGFGIGVNSNRINITLKNQDSAIKFFGDIRVDYTGVLLFAKYHF